ncbi:hypothetical protein [Paracoccus spongiarum]|uniref:Uncharacterized protein n=1 Tax=Paracoccus spongiarum TaxID=3064387 RepID=A0ABT9JCZ5_9RHOB|nr:hypothetical protein [Paracoccus sp. 2205BS29-5]MDP5307549.1 hypothetical protein [Paracoccus sp. 2205BS29-5]
MLRWLMPARRAPGLQNLDLGAHADVNYRLAICRNDEAEGEIADVTELAAGLVLRADPALGISGRYASPRGRLLEIDATARGTGDWFALHLPVGAENLADQGVFGFACRGSASEFIPVRACLRSGGRLGGFSDCFFDKHILLHATDSSHVDAITLQTRDEVPQKAPWRELVLFFPPRRLRLSLADLRVFLV